MRPDLALAGDETCEGFNSLPVEELPPHKPLEWGGVECRPMKEVK